MGGLETMTPEYETRLSTSAIRVTGGHDGSMTLSGVASATGVDYHVGGDFAEGKYVTDFSERIEPGAFAETLAANADVTLLVNHEGLPLARTSSRTLDLRETARGLEVEAKLQLDDPDVARLVPKLQRGDMDKMSIGFWVLADEWSDDYSERSIKAISLDKGDVSVVTHPANAHTSAGVRTLSIPPVKLGELLDLDADDAAATVTFETPAEADKETVEAAVEAANKVDKDRTNVPEGGYNSKYRQLIDSLEVMS